jgi:hypothetical protein
MTTDHWSTALTTKSDSWKKVPIKNTPKTWASLLQESVFKKKENHYYFDAFLF